MATQPRWFTGTVLAAGLSGIAALALGAAATTGRVVFAIPLVAIPLLAWRGIRRYDVLAVAVLLALAVPSWYEFGVPQAAVFRIAAVAALTTALFARRVRITFADGMIAAFVLITVFGWLLQDAQPGVGKIVLNEMIPVGFYVAARSLPSAQIRRVMTVAVAAGVVGAITVIGEFLVGHVVFADPTSYSWTSSEGTIFRPGGIFGSPPGAATVLAITILCGIPVASGATTKWRAIQKLSVATMAVACVLTFTRAGLIGLGVGLLVYLWLMRSSFITPARLVFAGLLLFVAVLVVLPQLEDTRTFQQGIVRPGDLAARESYWKLALPIIVASPHNAIFGIGSERTLIPRYGGTMPAALASAPVLVQRGTHNQYVLTALENGAVGLLALVLWLALTIRMGLRTARKEHDPLSAALVGALLAFAVTMSADNALLDPPCFAAVALVAGLIVARASMEGSRSRSVYG